VIATYKHYNLLTKIICISDIYIVYILVQILKQEKNKSGQNKLVDKISLIYIFLLLISSITLNGCSMHRYLYNYTNLTKPRYASQNFTTTRNYQNEDIKILSYNIKYAKRIDKAITILKKYETIKDADIILLQEMDKEGVQKIADTLKYNYVYYPAVVHPLHKKDFGNAILSKWPIINDQKIILPHFNSNKQRIAVGATIDIDGKKVMAFSLHLGIFVKPDQRKIIMDGIISAIPADIEHCVIGGDFNTFTKKDRKNIQDAFMAADFKSATTDLGWTNKNWALLNRKNTLDHIYIRGMKTVAKGKVIDRSASDHIPIWTDLNFEETKQPLDDKENILATKN